MKKYYQVLSQKDPIKKDLSMLFLIALKLGKRGWTVQCLLWLVLKSIVFVKGNLETVMHCLIKSCG